VTEKKNNVKITKEIYLTKTCTTSYSKIVLHHHNHQGEIVFGIKNIEQTIAPQMTTNVHDLPLGSEKCNNFTLH